MKPSPKSKLKLLKRAVECDECDGDGFDIYWDDLDEDEWVETCTVCKGTGMMYDYE